MIDRKKMESIVYKKMFENGDVMRWGSYVHPLLVGLSATFFIGLFSAGPKEVSSSICLWISTLLFSLSIILNSIYTIYYWFSHDDKELNFQLFTYSKLMGIMSNLAILLPIISLVFLTFYYSLYIGVIIIIFVLFLPMVVMKMWKDVQSKLSVIKKKRYEYLLKGDFESLEKLDDMHSLRVSIEEKRANIIEFCIFITLKHELANFLVFYKKSVIKTTSEYDSLITMLINSLIELNKLKYFDSKLIKKIKITISELQDRKLTPDELVKNIDEIVNLINDKICIKYYEHV